MYLLPRLHPLKLGAEYLVALARAQALQVGSLCLVFFLGHYQLGVTRGYRGVRQDLVLLEVEV